MIQAGKYMVNSNFNSKGMLLDFFAKWRKKGSSSLIHDILFLIFSTDPTRFWEIFAENLFNDLKST